MFCLVAFNCFSWHEFSSPRSHFWYLFTLIFHFVVRAFPNTVSSQVTTKAKTFFPVLRFLFVLLNSDLSFSCVFRKLLLIFFVHMEGRCIFLITVTWSEMPDHVLLTSADHQIKRERLIVLVIRAYQLDVICHFGSSYCYNDWTTWTDPTQPLRVFLIYFASCRWTSFF